MENIINSFLCLRCLNGDTVTPIGWILSLDILSEAAQGWPSPALYHQSHTKIEKNRFTRTKLGLCQQGLPVFSLLLTL